MRQQAITWNTVDPYLCRHMVSPGYNELTILVEKPDILGEHGPEHSETAWYTHLLGLMNVLIVTCA